MKKRRPKQGTLTRKCDRAFSLYVRQRDGACVECGTTLNLQAAHGFTRARFSTRWDERNCWALCREHHVYFTHRPELWFDWMIDRLGRPLFDELRLLSQEPWRGDKNEIAAHYTALLKEAA